MQHKTKASGTEEGRLREDRLRVPFLFAGFHKICADLALVNCHRGYSQRRDERPSRGLPMEGKQKQNKQMNE